ncbi:hypothetical protein OIDMADRAFT_17596, partial [Oidiodendron maius Zn]
RYSKTVRFHNDWQLRLHRKGLRDGRTRPAATVVAQEKCLFVVIVQNGPPDSTFTIFEPTRLLDKLTA